MVDRQLLAGRGRFIDDETRPGQLAMVVLRSPVAHGMITALDVTEARALPGVHLVLTAEDLAAEGIGPIALRAPLADPDGVFHEPHRPILAEAKVAYVGQPIAAVVADTPEIAQDALEAIGLDIDDLAAIVDPLMADAGVQIWEDVPGNTAFRWQKGNGSETDDLIASAAHVVTRTVHHPRIAIAPMEPRGVLAEFADGRYTLTTPSQGVSGIRAAVSKTMGIAQETLRVITHDVGGSFAAKIWPYPEHVLGLLAARLTGRPVKWIASRSESFGAETPGRGRVDQATLALDAEGRFLAFRIDAIADMGAFLSPAAASIVTTGAVRPFGQVYDIPGQHYRVAAVLTNAPPTDAYRGAGKPESTGTLERLIDIAARGLEIDPAELRRRNLIRPDQLPYATPMDETVDAGDFAGIMDATQDLADWQGISARKAESRSRGMLRGVAIGCQMHATGGSVTERSEVRALADGTVVVRTGSQDSGQGHRESLAIVAAEALEISTERIQVEQGDSAHDGIVGATGGSNLMPVAANTVHRTALAMLERARAAAADLLEAAQADLEYGLGAFRIVGTDRRAELAEIALHLDEQDDNCMAQLDFQGDHTTWPNGFNVCEVEIDPETGAVRIDRFATVNDLGRLVNEPAALGQILGGIGQGVGEALMEGMIYDPDGQPLTASFMDCGMPRADHFPQIATGWHSTDSPNALLGAKGVGELPSIGTSPVVVNAVLDALAPLGVAHLDIPLTPLKIWRAVHGKGG